MRHLLAAMDALVATVDQETELVRAGKLKQAATLEPAKTELARLYAADTAQVKANLPALTQHVPDLLAALRKQHETFNALLQINLTVLATAHAVSEGWSAGLTPKSRARTRRRLMVSRAGRRARRATWQHRFRSAARCDGGRAARRLTTLPNEPLTRSAYAFRACTVSLARQNAGGRVT